MIFHEIYGCYYAAVSEIIRRAIEGGIGNRETKEIVDKTAFSESFLEILPALEDGRWPFVHTDGTAPFSVAPNTPVSSAQKRFLKAISLDPRIRLFGDFEYPDVEPLFLPQDIIYFDRYTDGDPFEDEGYIARFRFLLDAIHRRKEVALIFNDRNGRRHSIKGTPVSMEYSEKDDKFRLRLAEGKYGKLVNLSRIVFCSFTGKSGATMSTNEPAKKQIVLEVYDRRSALERVNLAFIHYEKQVERIGADTYRMTIFYEASDEAELIVGVLSFGQFVKAVAPDCFVAQIKERLIKQLKLGLR